MLGVKGPVAWQQGLRASVHSVDVDVWVDPARLDDMLAALSRVGWVEEVPVTGAAIMAHHARTVRHPMWPCEIDLHWYFPGFLEEPEVVFERMWRSSVTLTVAEAPVRSPDRVGSLAVDALHALRDPVARRESVERLARLVREDLTVEEREELVDLAATTGASHTLAPVLAGVSGWVDEVAPGHAAELGRWRVRTETGTGTAIPALYELWRSPFRRKLALIPRLVWLSDAELKERYPQASERRWGLLRARFARLVAGVAAIPSAIRSLRSSRHAGD